MLSVKKVVSPVRFFDEPMLELMRWVSERYVAPLAAVIGRVAPPRVASEEDVVGGWAGAERSAASAADGTPASSHRPLLVVPERRRACGGARVRSPARSSFGRRRRTRSRRPSRSFVAVSAGGRRAIVLVPEAAPVPATAAAIVEAFGERVGLLVGGDKRARYRMWLEILGGRYDVVVGTRPARVRAGAGPRGRSWSRARATRPIARTARRTTTCGTSRWIGPGSGARSACSRRCARRRRRARSASPRSRRRRGGGPPSRSCEPDPRDAPLDSFERSERPTAVSSSRRSPATASRRSAASCGRAGGVRGVRRRRSDRRRASCGASCARRRGRCAHCGGDGLRAPARRSRAGGGVGRPVAPVPVRRICVVEAAHGCRERRRSWWAGPNAVRDLGTGRPRPGGHPRRRPRGAAARARRPRASAGDVDGGGRVGPAAAGGPSCRPIDPNDPAIQALVRGNPDRFHADEAGASERRRGSRSVPPCSVWPASADLEAELAAFEPITMLASSVGDQTVCLLALDPGRVSEFGHVRPRAGGPRRRDEGRGGTASLERRTVEPTT